MSINFEKYDSKPTQDKKWLVISVIAFLIIGLGGYFYTQSVNADKAEALFAQAKDQYEDNNLNTSLKLVNKAIANNNQLEYLKLKTRILSRQGKDYEREQTLEEIIKRDPTDDHALMQLSMAYKLNGEREKALPLMKKAAELDPDVFNYQIGLGHLYYETGDIEKFRAVFEGLIKKDPYYLNTWEQYAVNYFNDGDYRTALKIRQRSMDYLSGKFEAYFALAQVYDAMENKEKAVEAYTKSLMLHPLKNSIAARRIFEMTGKRVPPALEKLDTNRIPFKKQENVMIVDAFANGHPGKFMVDTGASATVMFKKSVEPYGIETVPMKVEIQTGNGKTQVDVCHVDVQLGQYQLEKHACVVIEDFDTGKNIDNIDGILGMNIFNHFRMEVDNDKKELVLYR